MDSTPFSRFVLRLRDRALRCYEIFLYTLLVAMLFLIAMPSDSRAVQEDGIQCGNIHSSAVVMNR